MMRWVCFYRRTDALKLQYAVALLGSPSMDRRLTGVTLVRLMLEDADKGKRTPADTVTTLVERGWNRR
jgi:hypothetical protein